MELTQSKDGTTIALDRVGEGPPVVIVGGALSDRSTDASLAAALASSFSVVSWDRRGRGDSGDTDSYSPAREVEDLDAVLSVSDGPACVFGSSSGGNLALTAAANGLAITKLALWEPNFIVDGSRPPLPEDYVEHLDRLVAADRRGDAVQYFMTAAVGLPHELVAPMAETPMWAGMKAVANTLAYDGAIVGESMRGTPPSAEQWGSVDVPTLVLDGGTTPWLSAGADAIAGVLPRAERRTLVGQMHNYEAPPVAAALKEFFGA
jgi:pimeloyl-ACP methyl ester carboxylesterase